MYYRQKLLKNFVTLIEFIIKNYQTVVDQLWLSDWQTDAITDWPSADHVRHFAATSFSLLQQLCPVDHGMFYMADVNFFCLSYQTNSLLQLLLEHGNLWNLDISQGSVATCLRWDGIFKYRYDFITNLLLSLTVKEVWKWVNIWGSCGQPYSVLQ